MDDELMFLPALEQARLVREGEVSARELVEASLDAIEALDGEVDVLLFAHGEPWRGGAAAAVRSARGHG